MSVKNGIVAFFDILGYQNLLIKNEPEVISSKILPFLNSVESNIKKSFFDLIEKNAEYALYQEKYLKEITDDLKCIVISDSILFTLPMDSVNATDLKLRWLVIIVMLRELQNKMFDLGLPIRGAVDYGKFIVEKNCFAGRTIIDAYQLSESLEVSACVFSKNAELEICKDYFNDKEMDPSGDLIYKYLVPTKKGEELLFIINAISKNINKNNVRNEVLKAFWGNNKDIPLSVQFKVNNTEQIIQFLLIKDSEKND